jgi:hypothetical protein
MEREDVRVLQPGGDLDFAQEAFGAEGGREVGSQDFDRDLPVVSQVFGDVDGRHAADAEFPLDAVPTGQCSVQAPEIGHPRSLVAAPNLPHPRSHRSGTPLLPGVTRADDTMSPSRSRESSMTAMVAQLTM